MGSVTTHEKNVLPNIFQFIALQVPLHKPMHVIAPVIQWVVLNGIPILEATTTVNDVAISEQNPLLGDNKVILCPNELITAYPRVNNPISIAIPPNTSNSIGTGTSSGTLLFL
eukprot:NODE_298_length_11435_cov_0.210303.p6 type:complete len:113 gc:universal NODE_298_length_11435_cov_0.210303:7320-6982(-)